MALKDEQAVPKRRHGASFCARWPACYKNATWRGESGAGFRALKEPRLTYCDFDALERMPLQRDPFEYFVVPDFIKADKFPSVIADYPVVPGPGSHPPA